MERNIMKWIINEIRLSLLKSLNSLPVLGKSELAEWEETERDSTINMRKQLEGERVKSGWRLKRKKKKRMYSQTSGIHRHVMYSLRYKSLSLCFSLTLRG